MCAYSHVTAELQTDFVPIADQNGYAATENLGSNTNAVSPGPGPVNTQQQCQIPLAVNPCSGPQRGIEGQQLFRDQSQGECQQNVPSQSISEQERMRMESLEMEVKNLREQMQGMVISHEHSCKAQSGEFLCAEQKRRESLERQFKEMRDMLQGLVSAAKDRHVSIEGRFDGLEKRAGEEYTEIKATLDLLIANTTSVTAPDGGGSRTKINEAKEREPETSSNGASLQLYVQGFPSHWDASNVGSRFEDLSHCKIVRIEPRGHGGCAIFTFATGADRAKAMKCNGEQLRGSPYPLLLAAVGAHRQGQVKTVGQQAQGSNRAGALPISQGRGSQATKDKLERRLEEDDEATKANEEGRIFAVEAAAKARRLFVQDTYAATPGLHTSELRIRAKESGFGCHQSKNIVRGFLDLQKQNNIRPKRAEQNNAQQKRVNIPPGGFLSGSARKKRNEEAEVQGASLSSKQPDVPGEGDVTVTGISSAVEEDSPSKVSSLFADTSAPRRVQGLGGGGMELSKEELASQIRKTHTFVDCIWKVNGKGIEKLLSDEGKALVNVSGMGACARLAVMVATGIPEEELDVFQKKCHDFTEGNWPDIKKEFDRTVVIADMGNTLKQLKEAFRDPSKYLNWEGLQVIEFYLNLTIIVRCILTGKELAVLNGTRVWGTPQNLPHRVVHLCYRPEGTLLYTANFDRLRNASGNGNATAGGHYWAILTLEQAAKVQEARRMWAVGVGNGRKWTDVAMGHVWRPL